MGPAQGIPKLTPKVGPNQFPQLISHNGTQFGAREQHNPNKQENHTYINLKENIAAA